MAFLPVLSSNLSSALSSGLAPGVSSGFCGARGVFRRLGPSVSSHVSRTRTQAFGRNTVVLGASVVRQSSSVSSSGDATRMVTARSGQTYDLNHLDFSLKDTDYMSVAKYRQIALNVESEGQSRVELKGKWGPSQMVDFGLFLIHPAGQVLHYAQGLFEGMKAQQTSKGQIVFFRPDRNAARMNAGSVRLLMPDVPKSLFMKSVSQTVLMNRHFMPFPGKGAMYCRPYLFGSGAQLGVAPSAEYDFRVFVSPVGPYFKGGLSGISLLASTHYHRAVEGGIGHVKGIGNYAPGMLPAKLAKEKGHAEILYLDARTNTYLEEAGAANIVAVFTDSDGSKRLVTPNSGTILGSVTRDSVVKLAAHFGMKPEERPLSVAEFTSQPDKTEVFVCGTAAVICPVTSVEFEGPLGSVKFNNGQVGESTKLLYDTLTRLQVKDHPLSEHEKFSSWVVDAETLLSISKAEEALAGR